MATFNEYLEWFGEVGYLEKLWESIAQVSGLPGVCLGEIVMFETGQMGQVILLKPESVEVLILSKDVLRVGTRVTRMGSKLMVPVCQEILGHTVDGLGRPITGGQLASRGVEWRPVDVVPAGIAQRKKIDKPMHTGVAMVDLMIPLGRGQRELVLGDRKTGKSNLLLQAIVSQAREGTVGVYAAIAKKKSEVKRIEAFLQRSQVWENTVLIATSSQDSPGEIFLGPYTAMAIAEYFRDKGKDVIVIFDDLTMHAMFYRELSLISQRFPGRDSYPGDIFHIHSKLLERGGNFNVGGKGVAITCLPVAETAQGDITGYIQTNLMSMTDGHIYYDGELFFRGRRPAINPFVSVTRVGHQTQTALAREAGRVLTDLLSGYERTQSFLKFGAELGESSRQVLTMGERVLTFFNQPVDKAVPFNLQLILLALLVSGIWNGKNLEKVLDEYQKDKSLADWIDKMVEESPDMTVLIEKGREAAEKLLPLLA
jgi:F-type H+-transporting ATPase subunit alpha